MKINNCRTNRVADDGSPNSGLPPIYVSP